jgi:hypothetical protein
MRCLLMAVPMALGLGAATLADAQDDLVARGAYLVEGPMAAATAIPRPDPEGRALAPRSSGACSRTRRRSPPTRPT